MICGEAVDFRITCLEVKVCSPGPQEVWGYIRAGFGKLMEKLNIKGSLDHESRNAHD